jgi:tripartite-type tricarboxylate transporter receptor subunit TctC
MTKPAPTRRRVLAFTGGMLAVPFVAARAEGDWPTRPVRYINSFPAGGPTDALSRIVCQQLGELTGQQFIVDNKGGSGGNVGTDAIAKSAPDGYTIGLFTISSHAISPWLYAKLPFDPEKDFTLISLMWVGPYILVTRPEFPAKTVPELIALAKANPAKYSYGSAGSGSTPHLCGELFKQRAGINLLHVPYRGGGPAMQDLLAGQVDLLFDNIAGPMAQLQAGKLRALGVSSLQRSPVVPDVPALAEFLPGFDLTGWAGMCGPAGLPPAMVQRASALVKKAIESDVLKAAYLKLGATPVWKSPADTVAFTRAEASRLAPIVQASGARVD